LIGQKPDRTEIEERIRKSRETDTIVRQQPSPTELQLQDLILRRVEKELRKMPDKSHNISFCIRLLISHLKEYLEHEALYSPPKRVEDIREYLVLEFQALSAVLTNIIKTYPDADPQYYEKVWMVEKELATWAQNRGFKRQEWK
jgi:hypothetical protein